MNNNRMIHSLEECYNLLQIPLGAAPVVAILKFNEAIERHESCSRNNIFSKDMRATFAQFALDLRWFQNSIC